jgi:large subunit ribosomal protein L13
MNERVIDAANKKLGRLATEVARILIGKDDPDARPHIVQDVTVKVKNAAQMSISEKKKDEKEYFHYSGFHGGLKRANLAHIIDKKGYGEALKRAVYGMLPKNKLRDRRIKKLIIEE